MVTCVKDRTPDLEIAPPDGDTNVSAALFKALLDASADHIYVYDRAGRYLYASPSGAKALGLSPEDMLGKHWRELGLPAEIMERFDALRQAVVKTGKPVQARTSFPTLSGVREYDYWILPLISEDSRIYSTACIARDIHQRLQDDEQSTSTSIKHTTNHWMTESAVAASPSRQGARGGTNASARAAQDHFQKEADSLPLLIAYVDSAKRYRFNNQAYENWFGQHPKAIQGRPIIEVLGESAYRKIRQYVDAALAGRHVSFEQVVPYKDAGPRLIRAHYIPDRTRDGKVQGFFATVSDITREGGQMEGASAGGTVANPEMSASRLTMVGEMTTKILHEIGQPLTAIASFSDASVRMLRRDDASREEILEYLVEVQTQTARARDIVRKLQRFLRSGRPSEAPVEINRLVRTAVRFMEPELRAQRINVHLCLMPDVCVIFADRTLLEQVLVNLIRNAIEAMASIDVGRRQLTLCTRRRPRQVTMTVSDSGRGIPAALREKIFQPFVTSHVNGFGIGLALSRTILEAHGGRLRAANRRGGGATFRISLPIDEG